MNVLNGAWLNKIIPSNHCQSFFPLLLLLHCAQKKVIYSLVKVLDSRIDTKRLHLGWTSPGPFYLRESKTRFSRENMLSKMNKQNKTPIWSYLRATLVSSFNKTQHYLKSTQYTFTWIPSAKLIQESSINNNWND